MARWYFLACVILTRCLVSGQIIYGTYGKVLHLNPGIEGQPENMLWKHNGNKVVEFDGQQEEVYSQFLNRVTLDWISGELNITGLTYDDGGEYKLEVMINKLLRNFHFKVVVIDKISNPRISCDINNSSSGTHGTQATLTCSADSKASVTYEWDSEGKLVQGPKLTISLGEEHDDKAHTCTVTNPLNFEEATFTAKDCYPAKTSSVALPLGIAAAVIMVLLLVALGLLYLKQKKKACFADVKEKVSDIEASDEVERKALIDRSPTIPSNQQLQNLNKAHGNMKTGHSDDREVEEEEDDVRGQFPEVSKGIVDKRRRVFEPQIRDPGVLDHRQDRASPTSPEQPEENADEDNLLPSSDKDDAEAGEQEKVLEHEPLDTEKVNEPQPAGGSDQREDTQATSEQPDEHLHKDKKPCPPTPPKKPSRLDSVKQPDAEPPESIAPPENKVPECEPSHTGKANEPEPAGGSDQREDTQAASEQPEKNLNKESKTPPPVAEKPALLPLGKNKGDGEADEHLDKDKKPCPPTPPQKPSRLDSVKQPVNKSDAEPHESIAPPENKVHNKEFEPSDTEKANEPEPAGGSDHEEDTQAEGESSTTLQRGYVTRMSKRFDERAEKHVDNDEKTCPPPSPKTSLDLDSLSQPGNNKENAEIDEFTGPSENKAPECDLSDTEKANEPDTQVDVESSTAPQTKGLEKKGKTTVSQHPENKVPECEPSDIGKANEPEPAGGSDHREDMQAESSAAPEQPESDNSHPANGSPPVPKPRLRSTNSSPDDPAGEHKQGTKSDPVNRETTEND